MSCYILNNALTEPPGGWRYEEIQSRASFREGSLDELVGKVSKHYEANPQLFGEFEAEDVRQKIIDWICTHTNAKCREAAGMTTARPAFISKCCGKK